jgi:hypothetical protein
MLKLVRATVTFVILLSCSWGGHSCAQLQAQTKPTSTPAQTNPESHAPRPAVTATKKTDEEVVDAEAVSMQRQAFGVSLIMTLADEARSYKTLALRPRIIAQVADALWDADSDEARTLFRRAWEAAVKADADDSSPPPGKDAPPAMVIALRKVMGADLRSEVLSLAARRDRALGEEFLAKLNEAREQSRQNGDNPEPVNDSWSTSDETSKRLRVAHRLLEENQVERAIEFAAPVLAQVNEKTIRFLSNLRSKKPDLADKQFLLMMARAEVDPTSDANTVSGLSSYAFTPGFYVTFAADGGVRWAPALGPIPAPNLTPAVRSRFFQVGGSILLRPSPPPDQDLTSAGRTGKHAVIKRLLPLFEQHAPDTALALRSQVTALEEQGFRSLVSDENALFTQGIKREQDTGTILDKLPERIGRAKTEHERNDIYADGAALLAQRGDQRAQELADKIEHVDRRNITRQYVDLSLLEVAIGKKNVAAVARLAKSDSLTSAQLAWAHTQLARLQVSSDRIRALETLEEGFANARRVDADDDSRPTVMIGLANEFLKADSVRAWEIANEAIKAANAVEDYTGQERGLNVGLITRSGLKLLELDMAGFSLPAFMRLLARVDYTRANDLAKSFKYEAPRAFATLAVGRAVLEERGIEKTR